MHIQSNDLYSYGEYSYGWIQGRTNAEKNKQKRGSWNSHKCICIDQVTVVATRPSSEGSSFFLLKKCKWTYNVNQMIEISLKILTTLQIMFCAATTQFNAVVLNNFKTG